MERSYFCSEQVGQMQATADSIALIKILYDSGIDVIENPIDFYCYQFGDQSDIFLECVKRLFIETELIREGVDVQGMTTSTYRLPFPELKQFYPLLKVGERSQIIAKINGLLQIMDDYFCELEMKGELKENCITLTFHGLYGFYTPLLKQLVHVKKWVLEIIRLRKKQMVSKLQRVIMMKMLYDKLGLVVDFSYIEPLYGIFKRILETCDITVVWDENIPYDTMISILNINFDRLACLKNQKDEAA